MQIPGSFLAILATQALCFVISVAFTLGATGALGTYFANSALRGVSAQSCVCTAALEIKQR